MQPALPDHYLTEIGRRIAMTVHARARPFMDRVESPIERGLLLAFVAHCLVSPRFSMEGSPRWRDDRSSATVFVQHKVGKFRVDFAIHVTESAAPDARSQWIAIECDGHDFHERTKEQAAKDRSRDRALTTAGFKVLRFTGSEIHSSSINCIVEVDGLVQEIVKSWRPAPPAT